MGATEIPSECLWHERWPGWGYVGVESVQSSFFSFPGLLIPSGQVFLS